MHKTKIKVLASAYACGPKWGSEIGMGWNWVIHLAQHCELTVITELGFRDDVEEELRRLNFAYPIKFNYIDVGEVARRQFWNQGDWRFYRHYRHWQQKAYSLALSLVQRGEFDVVHQLNMIGYREPGYLWKLNLPFVWGPIGGHAQMPWRFLSSLGIKGGAFHVCRNILNGLQVRSSSRVRKAMRRADLLISATKADMEAIRRHHGRKTALINETGCLIPAQSRAKPSAFLHGDTLRICWCGMFLGRKALDLALYAIARLPCREKIRLDIVGDGPEKVRCQGLAQRLGLTDVCCWHGQVPHNESLRIMSESHALLFTSLQEGTPHVVLESLSLGIPVICHDACGHGAVVDSRCGIKIPMSDPETSIKGFADAIQALAQNHQLLANLADGALARACELTWDEKARHLMGIYNHAIARFHQVKDKINES